MEFSAIAEKNSKLLFAALDTCHCVFM